MTSKQRLNSREDFLKRTGQLAQLIEAFGINQPAIAKMIGVSTKSVCILLQGKECCSEALLVNAEEAVGQLVGQRFVSAAQTLQSAMMTHSNLGPSFTISANDAVQKLDKEAVNK